MIHVLFCSSAAGILRQVLHSRRRRERVVDLTEHLDWGPIGSGDFQERAGWLDQNVPSTFSGGWDWIIEHIGEFARLVEEDAERTIWIEPHSAHELSGRYWYLERFGGSDAQMIIAPCIRSLNGIGVHGLSSMADFLDNYPRSRWDSDRFPENSWTTLATNNSLLRVVKDGSLQSPPGHYFDHYLLGRCSSAWTEWLRAIGNAMIDIQNTGHCVDDLFLRWRLGELIQRGAVVSDVPLPRYGEQSRALIKLAY